MSVYIIKPYVYSTVNYSLWSSLVAVWVTYVLVIMEDVFRCTGNIRFILVLLRHLQFDHRSFSLFRAFLTAVQSTDCLKSFIAHQYHILDNMTYLCRSSHTCKCHAVHTVNVRKLLERTGNLITIREREEGLLDIIFFSCSSPVSLFIFATP